MELVFIGPVLLPIPPEKIEIVKPGANSTTRLINDGEINIRHDVGLKSYSFDVILPSDSSYPFQIYSLGGLEATAFTTYFDELQKRKIPFPFIQVTWNNNMFSNVLSVVSGALNLAYLNTLCTIEEQSVVRDSANGADYIVSLVLKEYKDYGTKYVKIASEDANGNITYNVTKQTSSFSYVQELQKLSSEITDKLGAVASTAVSAFKLAQDGVSNAADSIAKSYNDVKSGKKDFIGW